MNETLTDPLLTVFDVDCSAEHAFDVWTTRIGTWWPKDHTIGGDVDLQVVLEQGVGGRILERHGDGTEHVWGEITTWEPPLRLGFRWHLGQPADSATDVEVRFLAQETESTRVEIEQRGWERFGDQGPALRSRNRSGWASLIPSYSRAIEED